MGPADTQVTGQASRARAVLSDGYGQYRNYSGNGHNSSALWVLLPTAREPHRATGRLADPGLETRFG